MDLEPWLAETLFQHSIEPFVNTWEAVACGKTEDQLIVTEQARKYMNTFSARTLVM